LVDVNRNQLLNDLIPDPTMLFENKDIAATPIAVPFYLEIQIQA